MFRFIACALAAWALAGCRSRSQSPPPPAEISFQRDIAPVLEKQCASAEGCHGLKKTHSVDLDLRPANAYDELVGNASETRPGAVLVQPGDPQNSFLLAKLQGALAHGEGKPMPLDPETGAAPAVNPLPATFVTDVLVPWIRAGSRKN